MVVCGICGVLGGGCVWVCVCWEVWGWGGVCRGGSGLWVGGGVGRGGEGEEGGGGERGGEGEGEREGGRGRERALGCITRVDQAISSKAL